MAKDIASIVDLTPDPGNANKGTERGLGILEDSLRKYGAGRSILVDKDGVVIAGNKTLESAVELGLPVRVVKTDGSELVVVQREDLDLDDGDKARELAYADNRSSQVGLDWDLERILADVEAGVDLSGMFYPEELDRFSGIESAEKITASLMEAVAVGSSDVRAPTIDLIYTVGNIGLNAVDPPKHCMVHCCLAVRSGWM